MKLSDQKIDPVKLEQGDWVGDIPDMGDLRLKVRGFGNKAADSMTRRLQDAVPRKLKVGGRVAPDEMERILSVVMRECILIDWDHLEGEDGKPVPYSKEMAGTLLTDPQYRNFRNAVAWAATVVADERGAAQEEVAKN